MENYPTNNPDISHALQDSQNNSQGYIFSTPVPPFENSQIPSFVHPINNFENQNLPLNMNPTLPDSFPWFGPFENEGDLAQNTGHISSSFLNPANPVISFGSSDSHQEQGFPNMSLNHDLHSNMYNPALPNSLQGFNLASVGPNMSQTFPNPRNPVSAIGINISSEAGRSNLAQQRKSRGRPSGSRGLFIESMVLEVPSGVDLIPYLVEYAQSRQTSVTVLGGFGSVSKLGFQYLDSQPLVFIEEDMTMMMSMSGTYVYSPAGPSSSQSFFNVMVAGQNSKIYNGKAYQVITAGITTLTVTAIPQIAQD